MQVSGPGGLPPHLRSRPDTLHPSDRASGAAALSLPPTGTVVFSNVVGPSRVLVDPTCPPLPPPLELESAWPTLGPGSPPRAGTSLQIESGPAPSLSEDPAGPTGLDLPPESTPPTPSPSLASQVSDSEVGRPSLGLGTSLRCSFRIASKYKDCTLPTLLRAQVLRRDRFKSSRTPLKEAVPCLRTLGTTPPRSTLPSTAGGSSSAPAPRKPARDPPPGLSTGRNPDVPLSPEEVNVILLSCGISDAVATSPLPDTSKGVILACPASCSGKEV